MKMITKEGWLTGYSLSCGYYEYAQNRGKHDITLKYISSGCYEVKVYNNWQHRQGWISHHKSIVCARKMFMTILNSFNIKRTKNKEIR